MKIFKKIVLTVAAVLISSISAFAQKESPVDFTANLQNNHLWRGLTVTDQPVIQVTTTFNFDTNKHWTAGFWGSSALSTSSDNTEYKEINYYIQYQTNGFSLGLWDLLNTRGQEDGEFDVWNYDDKNTGHLLDLRASYTLPKSFPLRLEADMILYGSGDAEIDEDGDVNQRYSTYVELSYPLYKGEMYGVKGFVGSAFNLDGDTHLYGNGNHKFDVVNLGLTASRTFTVCGRKFPVYATTLWNPSIKSVRMQIGVTLF